MDKTDVTILKKLFLEIAELKESSQHTALRLIKLLIESEKIGDIKK
jgi:hypothetical protein